MSERKSVFRSPVFRVIRFVVLVYAGLVILMGVFQRMYIYYPATGELSDLEAEAEELGLTAWRLSGGEFTGWKEERGNAANRLVVFHGNAGHALHREYYAHLFGTVNAGGPWEVYLFEYPGYGGREGRPSEKGFAESAFAALDELLEENERPVYLLGESLGGGVASRLAGERPEAVDGLVLLTPFTRLSDVGAAHFPFLPVRLLLRDHYDNERHLADYPGPVAMILAEHDEVVPARFGRELHEGFAGRKQLWVIEGADHNTLIDRVGSELWEEMAVFLVED